MQYIIETTNYGCIEFLGVNGRTFTKRTEKTEIGSKSIDDAGIYALEFMETAQLF